MVKNEFSKMKVSELKTFIKTNRSKANYKNITGMSKSELIDYAEEINNKIGYGIKDFFKIKKEYNNISKSTINKYGNWQIQTATIVRTPIFRLLEKFNVFKKLINSNQAYHLAINLTLTANNKYQLVSVEKQDQVNIKPNPKLEDDSEIREIPLYGKIITLNELLKNTEEFMKDKYFLYDAITNNCQDYLMAILKANQIGNEEDKKFIKQLITDLEGNMFLRKTLNTLTDLGTRVSQVMGKGKPCPHCDGCGYETKYKKLHNK